MRKFLVIVFCSFGFLYGFDHTHASYDAQLKKFVAKGLVDYKGFLKERDTLKKYLNSLSEVSLTEYNGFTKEQKLAFLINAYNAYTIELILENYPVKSIRKIGILPLAAWRESFFDLLGERRSLGWIEHEKLRKEFDEPRIHFAIVCASIGCPILQPEAYTAAKMESQLKSSTEQFLLDTTKNRYDKKDNILFVSSIFDWFEGDFTKKSTIVGFVKTYMKQEIPDTAKIKYTYYDWNLNER
ncbi:MAG: DUF547 domain-containing protein [Leptospiraceae bacterium]|nr:DUF547 domain-containing protein [Leptospiraceae bacterium]